MKIGDKLNGMVVIGFYEDGSPNWVTEELYNIYAGK